MSSRKTLKSVSVEELKPTVTLTPVIESCGEGCRIHHIKSDSIVRDGRDTFVPLRHVSKQKRRIFELEEQNAKLREQVTRLQSDWESERDYADQMEDKEKRAVAENAKLRELVRKWYPHMLKRVGRDALEQWGQMDVVKELGIECTDD